MGHAYKVRVNVGKYFGKNSKTSRPKPLRQMIEVRFISLTVYFHLTQRLTLFILVGGQIGG